jgi:hypothetical protein
MLIEANIEMSEAWNITSPILTHKIFKGKEKVANTHILSINKKNTVESCMQSP